MKVLIAGATGMIGKEALQHCLIRPEVTQVVALSRRELPENVKNHEKLKTIIVKDFKVWPEDVLEEIKDAAAIVW